MKRIYLPLLLLFASLSSCELLGEKDEDSRTELLVDGGWRLTSYVSQLNNQAPAELFEPSCDTDDNFFFEPEGIYIEDRGTAICTGASNSPSNSRSNWSAPQDVNTLTITGVAGDGLILRGNWEVRDLSSSSLQLYNTTTTSNGSVRTTTVLLKR